MAIVRRKYPFIMPVQIFRNIREVAARYDGIVLDLWGVVHDGRDPYPGAVDCLTNLRRAGKRVILLSNAPRRSITVTEQMLTMHIGRDLYDDALSSGELAYRAIVGRTDPFHAALGRRCLHIGPERDRSLLADMGLERVDTVAEADFILNTGPWEDDETVADYEERLVASAARRLPMVCANPDIEVIRAGKRIICAGALAKRYEQLGAPVAYHGKPYPEAYRGAMEMMGIPDRSRVVAIGDSLLTDIKGGVGAGLDAILVTSGIHGTELGVKFGEHASPDAVERAGRREGAVPFGVVPALQW
jgi:HAD superfamily hydrolase (TIGR01459 family)